MCPISSMAHVEFVFVIFLSFSDLVLFSPSICEIFISFSFYSDSRGGILLYQRLIRRSFK